VGKLSGLSLADVDEVTNSLEEIAQSDNHQEIRDYLDRLLPEARINRTDSKTDPDSLRVGHEITH